GLLHDHINVLCHTPDIFPPHWEVCLVYGVHSIQAQHLKVAWDDRRNSRRCCILDTVIKRIDGATRQDDMNDLL
ncbi:MAG: hypothetical protein UY79_C0001G0071, partial [Parcubacteria group bacterium GW2011_GWA2_53_21]